VVSVEPELGLHVNLLVQDELATAVGGLVIGGVTVGAEEHAFILEGKPPDDYLCPVGMCLMTDPVVAADGRTYQREALQQVIDWAREREWGDADLSWGPSCACTCCELSPEP
jgi:hypothetical protein